MSSESAIPAATPSAGLFDLAMTDEDTLDLLAVESPPSPEAPGVLVAGRYELMSVLGEGGTGKVWLARQLEPVKREVAVKIIRPGLLMKPVSARFNREHQVLARLGHPHVAAVFDAGELEDGRTFFVMEAVMGSAITRWVRDRQLPLRERLAIFHQACLAVEHAHQRSILHRDLKPSNVMVTEIDGAPSVKVIDFGIAKALEGDLTGGQSVTLRGTVLGTPRYMCPEQAAISGVEMDARGDVYSLGVLLYEILTGTTPIREEEETKDTPLRELLRRVGEDEIEPPSKRVASGAPAHAIPARELKRELDWITLKALQKNRVMRYESAQALASDVQRYLDCLPVLAGPPGLGYRLTNWLARHRLGVRAAAAVLVALAGGIAATLWALDRAEKQRLLAQDQAQLADQVSDHLTELLANAREHAESGLNSQILRKLADQQAEGLARFDSQPRKQAELAWQLGELYTALGERPRAQPWYVRHAELIAQMDGAESARAVAALYEAAWRYVDLQDNATAIPLLRRCVAGFDRLHGHELSALLARKELGRSLARSGQHAEAQQLLAEAVRGMESRPPEELARVLRDQAEVLRAAKKNEEAIVALHRALEVLPGGEATITQRSYILLTLSTISSESKRYQEALAASTERLQLFERQYGPRHQKVLDALMEHARLASHTPGMPGAEAAARRALDIARSGAHETKLANAWTTLAECLRLQKRMTESEQAVREALAELEGKKAERWRVMDLHRRLGDLLTARKDFSGGLDAYEAAASEWFEPSPGRPREVTRLLPSSLVAFYEAAAKHSSPLANAEELARWRKKLAELDKP
ncbi:MAG: protein kinase [Verrucomicrobiaceae bacterium]|nr:protein kinase [Verrucomicrobiaceae bacterium]